MLHAWSPVAVPVDPDAEEARRWLLGELAKPEYEAAKPTWFDRLSAAIGEWFASLRIGGLEGPPLVGFLVVLGVVVAVALIAFLMFGLPRLRRRSAVGGELFGVNDVRSAAELRAAGSQLAAAGDFAAATAEMFRAIARGLAERVIVDTAPGTTAHGFADRAAAEFPAFREPLRDAADIFDDVRYLGRLGTEDGFRAVSSLEEQLRATTPRPLAETVDA
jgi:hypothetical protein